MIRKAILFGLAVAVLAVMAVVPTQAETLRKGMRSEEIKEIQEMLKQDPEIYPEGYTTGYYGPLTEGAVKRLQKKYDLPQTGIIDEETKQKIYPWWHRDIKVTSPNGGETWNRTNIQTIEWFVSKGGGEEEPVEGGGSQPGQTPPQREYPRITDQECDAKNPCENENLECYAFPSLGLRCAKPNPCSYYQCPQDSRCILLESYPAKVRCVTEEPSPPWAKASIDLFRRITVQPECKKGEEGLECGMPAYQRSVFVKHIGTTNLFNGNYSWRISNRVKNRDDYVVRVSTGRRIISTLRKEGPAKERALQAMPRRYWKTWDESDKPFTITGETPPPAGDIEEAIKSLKEIQDELRKVSRLLDKVVGILSGL